MKRRKQKELARKTIRHALSKNGVKNYKDIYMISGIGSVFIH